MKKLLFIGLLGLVLSLSIANPGMATGEFTEVNIGLTPLFNSYIAWGDYNNDGLIDLIQAGRDFTPPNYLLRAFLYENNGDGTFTKITNTGVVPVENGKIGWIDYDKDGYMDLIVYGFSSSGRITKIYHNNSGNGTFTDINAGLPGVCQGDFSWADYDSDGYPDFIMTGQASDNSGITKLYHNNGSGGFNEVSCAILNFSSSSLSWVDFNNDGRPDIFIEGYSGGWKTKLYRNDGLNSNGEPQFIPVETNIQPLGDGRNAWGDYDNDGDLDLVFSGGGVGGYPVANDVYRNDGVGTQSNSWVFTKLNANLIPSHIGATNDAWSVGWGDYDNDGDLDILMTGLAGFNSKYSVVYRNDGPVGPGNQWVFTDINAGLQPISWGNTVWGDYDNDGDLDIAMSGTKSSSGCGSTIAVAKLYRNNLGSNVPVLNTIPDAPLAATLDAVVSGSNVTLSWGNGSDYQTPVNGLYYNIVVGTTANPLSVISPMAEVPGGYRHTPTIGTQNQNLSWEVKNLPAGTYDWGVQAIDTAFAGSPFALGTFTIGSSTTYTISGTVTLEGTSNGLGGVTITASSIANGTTTTDPDGTYTITDVPSGWTGTITASCTPPFGGYTFSGPIVITTPLTGPLTEQDFIATPVVTPTTWAISGMVTLDGVGLPGIDLYEDQTSNVLATTQQDPAGYYEILGLPYGEPITVSPYDVAYTFNPTHIPYTGSTGNQENQDYVATLNTYTISGRVTLNGEGLEDVDLRDSQQNLLAITGPGGYYVTMPLEHGWPETVTPHFNPEKYIYDPVNRSYNLTANQVDQDYTATLKTFTISGTVSDLLPNNPYSVTITATGTGNYVGDDFPSTVNTDGSYSTGQVVPYNWTGDLIVTSAAYNLTADEPVYNGQAVTTNITQDYTASLKTFTISGDISGILSPNNPYPITITAESSNNPPYGVYNSFYDIDATDGSYLIPDVPYGWEGKLTASSVAYDFDPTVITVASVTDDLPDQDFAATLKEYTISGDILDLVPNNTYAVTIAAECDDLLDPWYVSVYDIDATDGNYAFTLPHGWQGVLIAKSIAYELKEDPEGAFTSPVTEDEVQDYIATLKKITVSGLILGIHPNTNNPPPITITAECSDLLPSPWYETVIADATDGSYSMLLPYGWDGKLIAASPVYILVEDPDVTFNPPVTEPQEQNYRVKSITFTISGTVYKRLSPNEVDPMAGVYIIDMETQKVLAVTDNAGEYSFDKDSGWSGRIKPRKDPYRFSPTERTYEDLSRDMPGEDYDAYYNVISHRR